MLLHLQSITGDRTLGTSRLCNRSRGAKVPLLNEGYIEHVNTMGDRITVL